jgi:hypothetical protein
MPPKRKVSELPETPVTQQKRFKLVPLKGAAKFPRLDEDIEKEAKLLEENKEKKVCTEVLAH